MPLWKNHWALKVAYYFWIRGEGPIPKDADFQCNEFNLEKLADVYGYQQHVNIYGAIWECKVFRIPLWDYGKLFFCPTNESRWAKKSTVYIKDDGYVVYKIRIIGKINFYINMILQDMEENGPIESLINGFYWESEPTETFWKHYKELKPYLDNEIIKLRTYRGDKKVLIRITKTKNIYENMVIENDTKTD